MFAFQWTRQVRGAARRIWPAVVLPFLASCGNDTEPMPVVPVPVASVTVSPPVTAIVIGAAQQYTATPLDAHGAALTGRAVQWSTSDASRATVSAKGLVTPVAEGDVRITATSEGKSGFGDAVVVFLPVASVSVTPAMATVNAGGTQQLTGKALSNTGAPLPGRVVTWTSSDASKVIVNTNGVVTGVAAGSATITASCEGQSASVAVTVVP